MKKKTKTEPQAPWTSREEMLAAKRPPTAEELRKMEADARETALRDSKTTEGLITISCHPWWADIENELMDRYRKELKQPQSAAGAGPGAQPEGSQGPGGESETEGGLTC